jgi:hypothetical protein
VLEYTTSQNGHESFDLILLRQSSNSDTLKYSNPYKLSNTSFSWKTKVSRDIALTEKFFWSNFSAPFHPKLQTGMLSRLFVVNDRKHEINCRANVIKNLIALQTGLVLIANLSCE